MAIGAVAVVAGVVIAVAIGAGVETVVGANVGRSGVRTAGLTGDRIVGHRIEGQIVGHRIEGQIVGRRVGDEMIVGVSGGSVCPVLCTFGIPDQLLEEANYVAIPPAAWRCFSGRSRAS